MRILLKQNSKKPETLSSKIDCSNKLSANLTNNFFLELVARDTSNAVNEYLVCLRKSFVALEGFVCAVKTYCCFDKSTDKMIKKVQQQKFEQTDVKGNRCRIFAKKIETRTRRQSEYSSKKLGFPNNSTFCLHIRANKEETDIFLSKTNFSRQQNSHKVTPFVKCLQSLFTERTCSFLFFPNSIL